MEVLTQKYRTEFELEFPPTGVQSPIPQPVDVSEDPSLVGSSTSSSKRGVKLR